MVFIGAEYTNNFVPVFVFFKVGVGYQKIGDFKQHFRPVVFYKFPISSGLVVVLDGIGYIRGYMNLPVIKVVTNFAAGKDIFKKVVRAKFVSRVAANPGVVGPFIAKPLGLPPGSVQGFVAVY